MTNNRFGYIKHGRLMLIEDDCGCYQMPSVITFINGHEILIGKPALQCAHMYNNEFVYEIQRLIGQSMDNPKVQEDIKRVTYNIENDCGSPKIIIKNNSWDLSLSPEQISGYIIEKILKLAEFHLKEPITEAVITVPAYFGDNQRTATKHAATIAGLQKVHILNETTAVALAFQHSKKVYTGRNVLVYDFRRSTFEVSIIQIQGYRCKVLAVDGDYCLGGTNIDMNLVDFILADILQRHGEIISSDKRIMRRLKMYAENLKEKLSTIYTYTQDMDFITSRLTYKLTMKRKKFEEINQEIFEKTLQIVKRCIQMSGLNKDQIDEVVLAGGCSRIPKIQDMLKLHFSAEKVNISRAPEEMVAYGAAVYADNLYANKKEASTIEDVLSLSLGTDIVNENGMLMSIIIKRNTQIPCESSKKYVTADDNQTEMDIRIYQGEKLYANENTLVGDFVITNLTPAPKGMVLVEIKLSVDVEGILSVTAKELNTDNEKTLQIDLKNQRRRRNKIEFKTA